MDKKHLALVKNSMRQSGIEVYCLLCKFETISLKGHQNHLDLKHKDIKNYLKSHSKTQ